MVSLWASENKMFHSIIYFVLLYIIGPVNGAEGPKSTLFYDGPIDSLVGFWCNWED